MEWQGVKIDIELLKNLSEDYTKRLTVLSQEIYKLAGEEFNCNSPKQIGEVLFKKLMLPKSKKTKTGLSTDVDALEKLASLHPVVPKLLEYREAQKLLSTYIDAFPGLVLPEIAAAPLVIQSNNNGNRKAFEHQPEPSKHPCTDRWGPKDTRSIYCAKKLFDYCRRLFAD